MKIFELYPHPPPKIKAIAIDFGNIINSKKCNINLLLKPYSKMLFIMKMLFFFII